MRDAVSLAKRGQKALLENHKKMEKKTSFDYLVRATDEKSQIRVFAARTTRLVEEARERHGTYPTVTAALGRVLTATAIMGAMRKGNEKVILRFVGNGPVGTLTAEANPKGEVRGFARNPNVHVPLNPWNKFDVAAAVGKEGYVHVTHEFEFQEPYMSSVPIVSGEIAKDLVYYFYSSEQIPAIVSLGVLVGWEGVVASGGLILQLLPGADKALIPVLEQNADKIFDISRLIEGGATPEDLISRVLEGLGTRFMGKQALHFKCRCSKERLKGIVLALGEAEIRDILSKEGQVEAYCHFCNHRYVISRAEITSMLERLQ